MIREKTTASNKNLGVGQVDDVASCNRDEINSYRRGTTPSGGLEDTPVVKETYIEEDKDGETFYEIFCMGPSKCGSFVSVTEINHCPKCRSEKILRRKVKKKIDS
ncbi:MAG: hypothetical protein KAI64_07360 [Thermoplasmata archaeon]|nr:hypothetical protein [Thermoplasmata archaeon]